MHRIWGIGEESTLDSGRLGKNYVASEYFKRKGILKKTTGEGTNSTTSEEKQTSKGTE